MQTVYIDIFFLINFSMDFLSLFIASRLLSRRVRVLRLALAALLGGAYACLSLVLSFSARLGVFSLLIDALACLLMALIAVFSRKRKRDIFSFSLVFGAVSILLGGAMTALFALFNRMGLDRLLNGDSETASDGISVWLFAAFAVISAFLTLFGGRFLRKKSLRREGVVEITYRNKTVSLNCICDSGNLLREPISQKPCVIVELDAVHKIFPREICNAAYDGDISSLSDPDASRVRLIPSQSVSGAAMLLGVRADKACIDMGRGRTELDVYIVLSKEKLFLKGVKALVPSEIVLGAA